MPQKKKSSSRKYGPKAGKKVELAMREMKEGKLKSGRSGKKVTSRKQAVAIGLSEARASGAKVPKKEKVVAVTDSIARYNRKRDFARTPEPAGKAVARKGRSLKFVIQKHRATQLHYDFRLEAGGVLKSWAVPKGPSLDPADRRLAMQVEDHPLAYGSFEGIIPKGNYGAGEVIVWDRGTYRPNGDERPEKAIGSGEIKFTLRGKKLRGGFTLVKMRARDGADNAWLLIKERDDFADRRWRASAHEESVKSGRTLADLKKGNRVRRWISTR